MGRPTDDDDRRRRLCGGSLSLSQREGKHGGKGKGNVPFSSSSPPLLSPPLRSLGYRRGSRTSEWTIARGFLRLLSFFLLYFEAG